MINIFIASIVLSILPIFAQQIYLLLQVNNILTTFWTWTIIYVLYIRKHFHFCIFVSKVSYGVFYHAPSHIYIRDLYTTVFIFYSIDLTQFFFFLKTWGFLIII